MKTSIQLEIGIAAFAAVILTGGTFWWNVNSALNAESTRLEMRAKNLTSQVDSLSWVGKEKKVPDSIRWAIAQLSLGVNEQDFRIQKFIWESRKFGKTTDWKYDTDTQTFTYDKALGPQDDHAIRVILKARYVGFLGASTKLGSDLLVVMFFTLVFLFLWLVVVQKITGSHLITRVQFWIEDSKPRLLRMGANVRDLVKTARNITVAAAESKKSVADLRSRIHKTVVNIRSSRDALLKMEWYLDSIKKDLEDRDEEIDQELFLAIQKVSDLNRLGTDHLRQLEIDMEPFAKEADLAFDSYEGVFRESKEMGTHIQATTQALIRQGEQIRALRERIKRKDIA